MISDERDTRCRFKQQITPLLPPLAQTVRFLVDDERAADGMLFETVQEAYRSYRGDLTGGEFRRWIFERAIDDLARHNAEHYRRGAVAERTEDRDEASGTGYGGPDDAESIRGLRRRVRLDLKTQDIHEAAETLPFPVRAVMALSLAAELSREDIAPVLKVPVSVVRERLNEGRRLMREAFCERLRQRRSQPLRPGQSEAVEHRSGVWDYDRSDRRTPGRR